MFSAEAHYLISKDRQKDMRRDAARHQLIRDLRLQQPSHGTMGRSISGKIGALMVTWGAKLQRLDQGRQQPLPQQRL